MRMLIVSKSGQFDSLTIQRYTDIITALQAKTI